MLLSLAVPDQAIHDSSALTATGAGKEEVPAAQHDAALRPFGGRVVDSNAGRRRHSGSRLARFFSLSYSPGTL